MVCLIIRGNHKGLGVSACSESRDRILKFDRGLLRLYVISESIGSPGIEIAIFLFSGSTLYIVKSHT